MLSSMKHNKFVCLKKEGGREREMRYERGNNEEGDGERWLERQAEELQ